MPSLMRRFRTWLGGIGALGQRLGRQHTEPFTRVGSTKNPTPAYDVDAALQVSAIWAAAELLVDTLASMPMEVRKRSGEGYEDAPDSDLWRLLHDAPNRRHTPMEFMQYLGLNYFFEGNGYARLVRGEGGRILEMWPMAARQTEAEVLSDGDVVYHYTTDNVRLTLAADSVLHWRDKGNGVVGLSRLEYMRNTVGLSIDTNRHSQDSFARSGKRPGVFMIDKLLKKEQRDEIRKNYKELTEGDSDDLLVLELGAKFEPLALSPADLQLMETRRFTVEEIGRWFGIPSVLINDVAASVKLGSGLHEVIEGFYKLRLRAVATSFEQAVRARVMSPAERTRFVAKFNMDELLRTSLKDRVDVGARAVQNGLQKRNEWRRKENLPPVDGGDLLTVQSNLIPISMVGQNVKSGKGADGEGNDGTQDTVSQ